MAHRKSLLLLIASAAGMGSACGSEPITAPTEKAPLEVDAVPHGHTFEGMTTVELTSSRPAQIFYTLGGEDPIGPAALVYTGPLELDVSTLVTFTAVSEDGIWSAPQAELYSPAVDIGETPEIPNRALSVDRNNQFFSATPGTTERMTTTFEIRSIGFETVHISQIYIGGNPKGFGFYEDGVFQVESSRLENFDLVSGDRQIVTVSYQPTTTLRGAVLVIESDEQRESDGYILVELWGRILNF